MSKLTRSNVAYDLNISPHKYRIDYGNGNEVTFVFSSNLYLQKFNEGKNAHREKINGALSKRYGFRIQNNMLCDLKFYTLIEKRGFLIYKGPVKFECLNDIKLDGAMMTKN